MVALADSVIWSCDHGYVSFSIKWVHRLVDQILFKSSDYGSGQGTAGMEGKSVPQTHANPSVNKITATP